MPRSLQTLPQFAVVINLAVEHAPHRAVCVRNGLHAGRGEVYDTESPVDQRGTGRIPTATAIGSSVIECFLQTG
jgi:hypothetical protein